MHWRRKWQPTPVFLPGESQGRGSLVRLFAEAAAVLQGFQTQVLGFIDEGEAAMLGRSQGDLRRQEEQRSRLSRARHNLSQVPEADSVSSLPSPEVAPSPRATPATSQGTRFPLVQTSSAHLSGVPSGGAQEGRGPIASRRQAVLSLSPPCP